MNYLSVFFVGLFVLFQSVYGAKYMLPLESVFYIGQMKKAEFVSMYPGTVIQDPKNDLKTGFYIVYEHESLFYYFGPADNRALLKGYKEVLDGIVVKVKEKRPSLVSAKTYFYPEEENKEQDTSQPSVFQVPQPIPTMKPWWETVFDILGW